MVTRASYLRLMGSAALTVALCGARPVPAGDAQRLGVRTNHEGRVLPPLPSITKPVMFNTPEADAILAAMQILPKDSPWNEDVSKLPVHPLSDKIVRNLGSLGHPRVDVSENFVIVPPNQPKTEVKLTTYKQFSDTGPFPIPDNAPIQGWGLYLNVDLEKLQRAQIHPEGDRHVFVVDPVHARLYEFFGTRRTDSGWEAKTAVTWDLSRNQTRPKDWPSADGAGLPMFPGVVRYDELDRGMVEHALRMTVSKVRKGCVWPATHPHMGSTSDTAFPAAGERLRLKAGVDLSRMPKHAKAIALAMKKYGLIVSDIGPEFWIAVTPDTRLNIQELRALDKQLKYSDFEVVVATGEREGPRADKP